ncbi:MAG: antitoxin [Lachnospiraceae bacterium]|nr:antitoxin [Lachnospiraceae bacterium]
MPTISLRVPEEELRAFKAFARINNCSLSDAIRKTMLEKIEDEYDRKLFAEYEQDKESGTLTTRPVEDLWEELGL